jgi:diguanylate cyclase (GGDEF)-like protein
MNEFCTANILVVDDHPVNTELLEAILEGVYRITIASSGEQALELLNREKIDLILLDIMMPGMDGYEACKQIKGDPGLADIPVIFVTAMTEVEDETLGFELGAVDYIAKPVSPPIVLARVRTHLELKRQRDRLMMLSLTDGLTGIPNRRLFDQTLEQEWQRARRAQGHLALLLVDIDHFKKFNDDYGHVAGDDCLRTIAGLLRDTLNRSSDFVCRYGGEEFAVILPETSLQGATATAERLCQEVAGCQLAIPGVDKNRKVTLSIGVGVIQPGPSHTVETFIEQVDSMLYRAKSEGRNRVVGDSLSPPSPEKLS